jgi:ABC-type iron transport system FetAB ATPase subunit
MKPWTNENPTYYDYPISDLANNPMVAALKPPPESRKESIKRLLLKPDFDPGERELSASMRVLLPDRLSSFMFPTDQHLRILNIIYPLIIESYRHRNPLTAEGQRFLHEAGEMTEIIDPVTLSSHYHPSKICFLTGLSGVGKTTLIHAIMRALGKPVIRHTAFRGEIITESQIIYLIRNIPDHCSTKALCKSFGNYTDILLEKSLYSKSFASTRVTENDCVAMLRSIIATYHVGALVIDNVQNIKLPKTGRYDPLIILINNLCEELGIPIILVGTYNAVEILMKDASIASRLTSGGYQELERPGSVNAAGWSEFCDIVWDYQWVRNPIPIDDKIRNTLYDCSQGITRIMLNLFITAQKESIQSHYEKVDLELIKNVYKNNFRSIHGIIEALRSGDTLRYEDLFLKAFTGQEADKEQSKMEQRENPHKKDQNQQIGAFDDVQATKSKPNQKKQKYAKLPDEQLMGAVKHEDNGTPMSDHLSKNRRK